MKADSSRYHLCFEVLGNPLRIEIIKALKAGPKSVNVLVKELKVEQSRLSHSIAALKKCNFVKAERNGKKIIYSLKSNFLKKLESKDIFTALEKHYADYGCECWKGHK